MIQAAGPLTSNKNVFFHFKYSSGRNYRLHYFPQPDDHCMQQGGTVIITINQNRYISGASVYI